jgi:tetratricopeptide (TPR) repeat protein
VTGSVTIHQSTVACAGPLTDTGTVGSPSASSIVPAQLPADVYAFTGRADELDALDALLARVDRPRGGGVGAATAGLVYGVSGTAGVGKTALALRWAHRVRGRFPDGQLYANLRGYDCDRPVAPGDALAGFLSALGVTGQDIPFEIDDRAARYRTEISARRMLVVLDNASSVEQVRPLLPGTPSCVVVVTSRDSLAGLVAVHGAHRLSLDLLSQTDAITLLHHLIGDRVAAEPSAAALLAVQCARLPLALRVAAELAAARPVESLSHLVDELADHQQRLALLDAGGDPRGAVRAVFSWSYRHLPATAARAFRLLGLHPGSDLDLYAAAALTDTDLGQARRLLDLLTRANLIHHTDRGRYGMHDLLRAYATHLAATQDAEVQRRAAMTRLFDHYLATASAAMDAIYPAESRRRPRIPASATPAPVLTDPDTARAWLQAEQSTLIDVAAHTATRGWPMHTIRLAATLYRSLDGGPQTDALAIHSHAQHAAQQSGDQIGQAQSLHGLGTVHWRLGRYQAATESFEQAAVLFRQAADRAGEAHVLHGLGNINHRLGRYRLAIEQVQHALSLFRLCRDRIGEARTLTTLGIIEERLGHHEQAADHLQLALDLHQQALDRLGEARALTALGVVENGLGHYEQAADHHQKSLEFSIRLGDLAGQAAALNNLGSTYTRRGEPHQAAEQYQHALILFRRVGDSVGEASALNGIGFARHASGDFTDAFTQYRAALNLATQIGVPDLQARAHTGLGHIYRATGDPIQARCHLQHALDLELCIGGNTPEAGNLRADLAEIDPSDHGPSNDIAPRQQRRS